MKFYASPTTGHFLVGAAGIDAVLNLALTLPKPAGFTGNSTLIVGQGFTGAGYPNPDFDNHGTYVMEAFVGIDMVRINEIPEPTAIGLIGLGAMALGRRSRR